jgi:hypothetical protein
MAASPELTGAREAKVGDITVRRFLPLRHRRTVGAWCFVDHYGPMSVDGVAGMQVPEAAQDWGRELRFGKVAGPEWEPLPAPPLDAAMLKRQR